MIKIQFLLGQEVITYLHQADPRDILLENGMNGALMTSLGLANMRLNHPVTFGVVNLDRCHDLLLMELPFLGQVLMKILT